MGSKIGGWRRQRETALIASSLTILLASPSPLFLLRCPPGLT